MGPKKLRQAFDATLKTVWWEWIEALEGQGIPEEGLSPFEDLDQVASLWENAGFNQELGWLTGVSNATGWPLDRPLGPKEWSPKGRHPGRQW